MPSDVHFVDIAGIDTMDDSNALIRIRDAKYDGVEVGDIRGRYTKELVQGHRGVLMFFKEKPIGKGVYVLKQMHGPGNDNRTSWVVMNYSGTIG